MYQPGDGRNNMGLNVHLSVPAATAAAAQDGSHTPNTPEILNSIVNMTNGPFAGYEAAPAEAPPPQPDCWQGQRPSTLSGLSACTSTPSPYSPSEVRSPASSAMSVQHYRSQFIKEGLKMKVQRKMSATTPDWAPLPGPSSEPERVSPASTPGSVASSEVDVKRVKREEELTEEDAVRRQRRRERNKVAATKCRNKKKLRTQLLVKESEVLHSQNNSLKSEIGRLEEEKKRLMEILSTHEPTCQAKRLKTEDAFRMPEAPPVAATSFGFEQQPDVKPQIRLNDLPLPQEEEANGAAEESFFAAVTCSLETFNNDSQGNFLAKGPMGYSYLDLDSRCIAL